jgi:two-component system, sensor histidine kinase and response regulator
VDNGLQAVERLAAAGPEAYDAVLMDLQMPVLDGLAATRRLRAQPRFDALPVIACTAHAMAEEIQRSRDAGMQGYLTKPLSMAEVVRVLKPYCGRTGPAPSPVAGVPTAAPLPARAVMALPNIPGLDLERALAHFDHSPALMQRMLRSFARDYGGGIAPWSAWLAEGRLAELHRAAHTLQGLAGTLGAAALRETAQALERHAAAGQPEAARAALARLQPMLGDLVAGIDDVLGGTETTPALLDSLPALAIPQALARLRELLEQSDSEVIEWWHSHRALLREHLPAPVLRAVGLGIHQFDFDAALAALNAAPAAATV